jgi:hypothetical protein
MENPIKKDCAGILILEVLSEIRELRANKIAPIEEILDDWESLLSAALLIRRGNQ